MKDIDRSRKYDPFVLLEVVKQCATTARSVADRDINDTDSDSVASALEILYEQLCDSGTSNS